jgi:hypothetical protein
MKFPGVISLRNALPIWAIPNGTFLRLTCWMMGKSTKIPWAVSGRSQTTAEASSTGPMKVLNIRLKLRGSVNGPLPQLGHLSSPEAGGRPCLASNASIRWSSRKRWWQLVHSTSGSENDSRCPEASHTLGAMMMAASWPTTSSRSCTIERHQAFLMLFFSSTPSGP